MKSDANIKHNKIKSIKNINDITLFNNIFSILNYNLI